MLVTAVPTREALDPVRLVSNDSSGKMVFALAEAAVASGAEATLISGPTNLKPPVGVRSISVESTSELFAAVKKEFARSDCLIMAAAPADFKPRSVTAKKMKKTGAGNAGYNLALEPTVDILKEMGANKKPGQVVVGFALETENALENARKKLKEKKLDMIVVNQPGKETGFACDTNLVTILRLGRRPDKWPLMNKKEIAFRLLEKVASLL